MDIHNGQLFWPLTFERKPHTNPEPKPFYDVIIVGGGMSGVLTAAQLHKEGLSIAILEQKEAAKGSTSANTGLLQWSNDIMLHELMEQIGEEQAVRFHKLTEKAVNDLEQLSYSLVDNGDFIRRPSVYFASNKKDAKKLKKEFDAMTRHGFKVDYWNDIMVSKHFNVDLPVALKTYDDAEVNPYKFAGSLIDNLIDAGVHLFENTYANVIEDKDGMIEIHAQDKVFKTKNIVYTTGYFPIPFGDIKGAKVNRSYAIVTSPVETTDELWYENALLWETARPYYYIRKTVDNRIVIGGLDERRSKAPKESKIEDRAEELMEYLHDFFPDYDVSPIAMYGASFGESEDNLPFVGEHPDYPGHYYLLGYGGNGTVCSMLGATILADLITGRPNPDAEIVTLDRKYGAK